MHRLTLTLAPIAPALYSVSSLLCRQMSQLLLRARRAGQDQVWIGLSGQVEGGETFWGWAPPDNVMRHAVLTIHRSLQEIFETLG